MHKCVLLFNLLEESVFFFLSTFCKKVKLIDIWVEKNTSNRAVFTGGLSHKLSLRFRLVDNRSSRSPNPRFGACSARDYLILTRVCTLQFVQTLQKYPKKPCRLVHFQLALGKGGKGDIATGRLHRSSHFLEFRYSNVSHDIAPLRFFFLAGFV